MTSLMTSLMTSERQVRPGDQITALDGEPLNGLKFSDALQRQQAAKEQAAKDAGKVYKAPISSQHFILMTRTYEVVDEAAVHHDALLHACRTTFGLLRQREQDLKWLVENPFWLPSPIEPLFKAMDYNVTEIAYLIAACLTDQKVAIPPARLPPSALSSPPLSLLWSPPFHIGLRDLRIGLSPNLVPRMAPLISPSDGAPHQPLGWCLAGAADLVGAGHALARVERAAGAPRSPNLLVHVHPLPAGDAARLLGRPDAHLGLNIALSDRHACGYDADHRRRRRRSLHRNRHRGL